MFQIGSTNERTTAFPKAVMPNLVPFLQNSIKASAKMRVSSELLRHPNNFPLEFKPAPLWWRWWQVLIDPTLAADRSVEFEFFAGSDVEVGTSIEVFIPLRGDKHRFRCRVLASKPNALGYRVGVCLINPQELGKVGLIERICWLECQLKAGTLMSAKSVASAG